MSREKPPFDRIDRALRGNYPNMSAQADALLHIIRHQPDRSTRVSLMSYTLTNFDPFAPAQGDITDVPGEGADDDSFRTILERLAKLVATMVALMLRDNLPVTNVAQQILRFLDGLGSDRERSVAFASILKTQLVPYAPLPAEFLQEILAGHENDLISRPRLRESRAMLRHLFYMRVATGMSGDQLASAVGRIFARHTDSREIAFLFACLFLVLNELGGQGVGKAQPPLTIGLMVPEALLRSLLERVMKNAPPEIRAWFATHQGQHPEPSSEKPN